MLFPVVPRGTGGAPGEIVNIACRGLLPAGTGGAGRSGRGPPASQGPTRAVAGHGKKNVAIPYVPQCVECPGRGRFAWDNVNPSRRPTRSAGGGATASGP